LVFFPLHIHCDNSHAENLLDILESYVDKNSEEIVQSAFKDIMDARKNLFDALLHRAMDMKPQNTEKLYDDQSENWVRKEPCCLSDFTYVYFLF
jgi:pyrroloquinoline quinone (PQQ) biosynthesis protein C